MREFVHNKCVGILLLECYVMDQHNAVYAWKKKEECMMIFFILF